MRVSDEEYLAHYGVLRRSGRYPYGSGKDDSATHPWGHHETEAERADAFLNYFKDLRNKGVSEAVAAKGVGLTVNEYRAIKSIAINKLRAAKIAEAERLRAKGMSNVAIAERMGLKGESNVRSLLDSGAKERADVLQTTATMLRERVGTDNWIDVGAGVERHLGISSEKLKAATAVLKEEGYVVHRVKFEQLTTGKQTEMLVLTPPGTEWKDVIQNKERIQQVHAYINNDGKNFTAIQPPLSVSSKRVGIVYKEDGGANADGVIYVRRGVSDLDMGKAHYAQVRIAVDGTHYIKGMAIYKDDMPDGVDLLFNTNKSNTGNKLDALKPLKTDEDPSSPTYNPFGSFVRQLPKVDANGNEIKNTVRSAMNIVNEEGSWDRWSSTLATQMLSKQNLSLAKQQLDLTYRGKQNDLQEILSLTNPAVRKKLLLDFADDADASAIHLKAMGLAGQRTQVLLPLPHMKETEVYAPNFKDGERVVLVRFPHGGTFEIPELVVNNRDRKAQSILGKEPRDAVGIHPKVAEKLSGADFDGDTVLVIPNNAGRIKTKPALEGLKNFDAKTMYKHYEGMHRMTDVEMQKEMGHISNLITDMTIGGANDHELAAAVRHSMVVIDAKKHYLNYKQSELDNNIPSLRKKYQNRSQGGAATLISRSGLKSTIPVPERKQGYRIDPATGKKIYTETGRTYVDKKGKTVLKTEKSPRLAEVDDAHLLSSGTPMEKIYAEHSNRMKALGNQARKELLATPNIQTSPSAKKAYAKEVNSLNASLDIALRNAPLERQAQLLASANVQARRRANPDMDDEEFKKLKRLSLIEARNRVGAGKELIKISDSEWAAIQAGALSQDRVAQILRNTDPEKIKERATPHTKPLMTSANIQRALSLKNSGKTQTEIAAILGVSLSTLKRGLGAL